MTMRFLFVGTWGLGALTACATQARAPNTTADQDGDDGLVRRDGIAVHYSLTDAATDRRRALVLDVTNENSVPVYVILGDADQHVPFYGRATSYGVEAIGSGGGSHRQHRACRASSRVVALRQSQSIHHVVRLPRLDSEERGQATFLRLEIPIARANTCEGAEVLTFDVDLPAAAQRRP